MRLTYRVSNDVPHIMLLWVFLLATRKTFLVNHADGIASMGLFVVPTIPFRLLCGFLILLHARGELLWLGVTAEWAYAAVHRGVWLAKCAAIRRP